MKVNLCNLDAGANPQKILFEPRVFGPFRIRLHPNYWGNIGLLPRPNCVHFTPDEMTGTFMPTRTPGRDGPWVPTLEVDILAPETESILTHSPDHDGGIWDLCQILTFLNGRAICAEDQYQWRKPDSATDATCHVEELFDAAELAWTHRKTLVDRKLTYALLLRNTAFQFPVLNVQAPLYSTAFNVIYDDWKRRNDESFADVPESAKAELKVLVLKAIDECSSLNAADKAAFKAVLCSRIAQGLNSALDIVKAMLSDLELIPRDPPAEVIGRVRFVNLVRNAFIHTGKPPTLEGNPDISIQYSICIACQLVPSMVSLALGRALGFSALTVGSLSQKADDFVDFFARGTWQGIPVEDMTYEQWIVEQFSESDRQDIYNRAPILLFQWGPGDETDEASEIKRLFKEIFCARANIQSKIRSAAYARYDERIRSNGAGDALGDWTRAEEKAIADEMPEIESQRIVEPSAELFLTTLHRKLKNWVNPQILYFSCHGNTARFCFDETNTVFVSYRLVWELYLRINQNAPL